MIHSVRGFRDILHPQSQKFAEFEAIARRVLALYGYSEIRLPTLEMKELFVKSTGETTDIVEKEMYAFSDAGGRELALRPEGTPGVARAYIENNLFSTEPRQKLYYIGNMFRAERPQAGRFREFEQIGAEYIASPHPSADAEVIILLSHILREAGVKDFSIEINSLGCKECRPKYRAQLLEFLNARRETLCESCKKRIEKNPLRALDCKADGEKLTADAPKQKLCPQCDDHFENVQTLLTSCGEKFSVNKNMARGLDYYSRTVFEFKAGAIGAQDAIAGGGRYDSLIKSMGGPEVAAVGWAMGVDRAVSLLTTENLPKVKIFVISLGKESDNYAFEILHDLRVAGIAADSASFSQSLKAQMRSADKSGAEFALIVGENEVKKSSCMLKNLKTAEQKEISRTDIIKL
ncbi:MAG: histidine--tRNA ligase [Elusimicrobia bacterium]|nr:histidine--tRNA ligase [Elusimicrobiota bacterium]